MSLYTRIRSELCATAICSLSSYLAGPAPRPITKVDGPHLAIASTCKRVVSLVRSLVTLFVLFLSPSAACLRVKL